MRIIFTVLTLPVLLAACAHPVGGDAALRAKIIGAWATTDVILPDQAKVSNVTMTMRPDGTWHDQYTITRSGESRSQTTSGTWQITNGFMIGLQTNVDGKPDFNERSGSSRILKLDSHEMILSNWYSPHRIYSREQ